MVSKNSSIPRRRFIAGASAATTIALAGCSGSTDGGSNNGGTTTNQQQGTPAKTTQKSSYPEKPIRLIIPFGTGGGFNFYSRIVAKYINENDYLPVQVKPKNVTGSGGVVGANRLYNSKPDGYTFGIWYMPGLARNQIIRPDAAKYDMRKLTPLPSAAGKIALIGVRKGTGIESASEYISAVKEGKLKFGSAGPLSAGRVIPVALGKEGDAYPYKSILDDYVYFDGKGEMYTAMKRGDVDVMAGEFSSVYTYVEAGEVRPILVISTEDSPPEQTPNVDTLADIDVSNPERVVTLSGAGPAYRVFAGPPDIPDERAEMLRTAIMKALENPELQKDAAKANRPISPADSDATGAALKRYISVWTKNKNLLDTLKSRR